MRTGYNKITPYLVCRDADSAIKYYEKHLGSQEVLRLDGPDGNIMHAEIMFDDHRIMISDEFEEISILSPLSLGGTPVSLNIYVPDVDKTVSNLLADGCKEIAPVQDQFHGDRSGKIKDPFGHIWHIATNLEDIDPIEIKHRFEKMMKG